MNRDDDFIATLEDYLDTYDGVVPLPERVRTAVQASLPSTRQVHPRRVTAVARDVLTGPSAPIRFGIAAAVVLVLVTGAIGYVAGPSGPGTGALPSPMPSVTPTPSPTSPRGLTGAQPASCGDGLAAACIAAGTYAVGDAAWPAPVTLDVPTGWFTWDPATDLQAVLVEMGSDAPAGSGWGIAFSLVDSVSQDPCDAAAGTLRPGATASAASLVEAMRSWPGFEVSAPTPVEVDGHPGLLVQVTSSRTAADCPDQAIWTTPSGAAVDAYPMVGSAGQPRAGTFRVVEAGGSLVVIRTTEFGGASPHELDQGVQPDPSRHAVDLAELRAILASIRIGS